MKRLEGKVVIVTGATSGIGLAAARLFAREGARLVLSARGNEALESLAGVLSEDGRDVATIAGDIRQEPTAARLAETALDRFGALHAAFNNAGGDGEMGPVTDISPAA